MKTRSRAPCPILLASERGQAESLWSAGGGILPQVYTNPLPRLPLLLTLIYTFSLPLGQSIH